MHLLENENIKTYHRSIVALTLFIAGPVTAIAYTLYYQGTLFDINFLYVWGYVYGIGGGIIVLLSFAVFVIVGWVIDPVRKTPTGQATEKEIETYQQDRQLAKKYRKVALDYFLVGVLFLFASLFLVRDFWL